MPTHLFLLVCLASLASCEWLLPFRSPDRGGRDWAAERVARDGASDARRDDRPTADGWRGDRRELDVPERELRPPDKPPVGPDHATQSCDLTDATGLQLGPTTFSSCATVGTQTGVPYFLPGTSRTIHGTHSIKMTCSSCAGQAGFILSHTSGQVWDLSSYTTIHFQMFTQNVGWNPAGTCALTPTIILRDTNSQQRVINRQKATTSPDPNGSTNKWLPIDAPLGGYAGDWAGNGNMDITHVKSIELLFSYPTGPSYVLWVDDLTFTGATAPFAQCSP
jgi:hypothetical protein